MYSLVGTLDKTMPALPAALVGRQAWDRVRAAAACLPAPLTDWIYLERRLGVDDDRLDLIVRVDRKGRERLRKDNLLLRVPLERAAARGWARIDAFARRWEDARTPWRDDVLGLWLELDLPATRTGPLPVPRLFLDYAPVPEQQCDRMLAPLVALIGTTPPAAMARTLERCFRCLPAGATVPSVGVAHIDRWQGVRLCVAGLPSSDLGRFLSDIAWPDDPHGVARRHLDLARDLDPSSDRISLLHLDLSPPTPWILERVGLEYALSPGEQLNQRRIREARFLDALVSQGLADARVTAALRDWPGHATCTLPHEIWPSLVLRRINHLKVVHDNRGVVETKAYLSMSHGFRRRRSAAGLYQ